MKYLLILLFLFIPILLPAQTLINEKIISQLNAAEELLLNAKWVDAFQIYKSIKIEERDNPVGYLSLAGAKQSQMIAFEENIDNEQFFGLLDSTIILCEKVLENCTNQDSAVCYLLLGHQNAYRAVWEARFGSNISAISYGFKARNMYNDGLKADSTLNDIYFGLGSYHYWKTVKAGILTWTGIFKNDREKGRDELLIAIDSSLFSQNAALSAMIWVYINEKEYNRALILAQEMNQKYSDGNFFLWPQAEIYYKQKKYSEAINIYSTILNRLKVEPGNYYNIIEIVYYLYQSYIKNDQKEDAKEILLYFNTLKDEFSKKTRRVQRRKISYLSRKK